MDVKEHQALFNTNYFGMFQGLPARTLFLTVHLPNCASTSPRSGLDRSWKLALGLTSDRHANKLLHMNAAGQGHVTILCKS